MMNQATIIVAPTYACNLACRYCYADSTSDLKIMKDDTLKKIIKDSLSIARKVHFIWHGGEPLLAGKLFYEKVIKYQKPHENRFSNSIQTNATLLTNELVNFFKNNKFSVGVSLDGPKELHDKTRVFLNGEGSFEAVMRGIKLLKKYRIKVGVILVLNRLNYRHVDKLYYFFKGNKINCKINPLLPEGRAKKNLSKLYLSPDMYSNAMIKFFDIWINDYNASTKLQPLEKIIKGFFTNKVTECNFSGGCKNLVFVNLYGDIYPCSRSLNESYFKLGNIIKGDLPLIFKNLYYKKIKTRLKMIDECSKCEWKNLCNGGCPSLAFEVFRNTNKPDPFCKARKKIFKHIYSYIKSSVEMSPCN